MAGGFRRASPAWPLRHRPPAPAAEPNSRFAGSAPQTSRSAPADSRAFRCASGSRDSDSQIRCAQTAIRLRFWNRAESSRPSQPGRGESAHPQTRRSDTGGWIPLGSKTEDEWPFVRNELVNRYRGYRMRSETPDYPPVLIGLFEAQNRQSGYSVQPPVLVGDVEAAKRVMHGGTHQPLIGFTRMQ